MAVLHDDLYEFVANSHNKKISLTILQSSMVDRWGDLRGSPIYVLKADTTLASIGTLQIYFRDPTGLVLRLYFPMRRGLNNRKLFEALLSYCDTN